MTKQLNEWANKRMNEQTIDKCTVTTPAARGDLLFPSFCLVSCCLRPNFPVESNHPENRICHRTPEVVRRGRVNSRARGEADSRRGGRSSLLSDGSESDWWHHIDLRLEHVGLFRDDWTRWLHKGLWLLHCVWHAKHRVLVKANYSVALHGYFKDILLSQC